jgi:pyruvate dehydrogenase E2 component (dihydrolipoamide acetyltransferase)
MATEIKLPELAEGIQEGEVLEVKVAAGAAVSKGQTLLEVDADKATIEVPSPQDGQVTQLMVKKGDRVHVGQVLCLMDSDGVSASAPASGGRKSPGDGRPGDEAKPRAPAAQAEPEIQSAASHPRPRPDADGASPASHPHAAPAETPPGPVAAGPATRRLARELGVDLQRVTGTGPGGRVTEDDIKEYVRSITTGAVQAAPQPAGTGVVAPPLPDFERWGPVERRPLEPVRRRTAEQMSLAWNLIPHVTQHDQADITELDTFRRQQEGRGPKLTITAFALKAAAIALQQYPQFNASLDSAGGQLVLKRYYHIGVAVDTDRGLLVPVVRDVDQKSVAELAQELGDLAERARQKKLTADDMRGGTFTISNQGGIGGTAFSPIVNWPEVAIMGLSRSRLQPVIHDGQVVPRLILPLCVSYDHRVVDGADAARFTRRLAELLENPLQMVLHA